MIAAFCNSKCVTLLHFQESNIDCSCCVSDDSFPTCACPLLFLQPPPPRFLSSKKIRSTPSCCTFKACDTGFFRSTLSQWRSAFACQSNKTIQNSCRFNSPSTYPKSNWRTTMLPRFQRPWPPPPVQCCADVHDALGQWRQRLKARGQTPKRSPVGTGMSWQIE